MEVIKLKKDDVKPKDDKILPEIPDKIEVCAKRGSLIVKNFMKKRGFQTKEFND